MSPLWEFWPDERRLALVAASLLTSQFWRLAHSVFDALPALAPVDGAHPDGVAVPAGIDAVDDDVGSWDGRASGWWLGAPL